MAAMIKPENVPVCVSVPDKIPPEDNVRPEGNVPEPGAKVGGGGPLAVKVKVNGVLTTVTIVNGLFVKEGGVGGETVMLKAWLALGDIPLVAVTAPEKVPTCVGIPERTPAEVRVRPCGKLPEPRLKVGDGVPLAV